ncbi:MAG: porin family protein [Flavobacterium sp.]
MKKIILLFVLAVSLSFGQDVKFGVRGGVNISDWKTSNSNFDLDGVSLSGLESQLDFNLGFFVDFKVSNKFSIQPEMIYSRQGTYTKLTFEGISADAYFNNDYINVPILFKYHPTDKFFLFAGPQVGFLLEGNVNIIALGESFKEDATEIFNSVDFSASIGAGVNLTNKLFVDVRYNHGFSNLGKESDGEKTTNSVFQLGLGYRF